VAAAIVSGDEQVFSDLVHRLSPGMLRLATTYVGSHAVAEEVVQEAWVSTFRGIAAFEGRSSLRTWVFRICVHGAMRRAGQEGRSLPFTDAFTNEGPTVDPSRFVPSDARENPRLWSSPPRSWRELPEDLLVGAETKAVLERAVNELPHRLRAVVVLRDVEGYTAGEVCQILDISEGNQRVRLHRARASLRAVLEHHLETK
jgi:RNA polymerase sigma-70 factor (ECF subfamily)